MIQYFRINDPYRLVGLLVLLLLMYIPLFLFDYPLTVPELKNLVLGEKQNEGYRMYQDVVDNSAPLGAWVQEIFDSIFGRSLVGRHIFAFVIIFLQSAYVGILFISRKVFTENTYIPSLMFSILFFFSWDTITLSNELLGSGFLLLALNYIFQEIEFRNERDENIFNVGLCISLASLFAFSFIVYVPAALIALLLFTRSTPRKYLLLVFGFLLPHMIALSIAYLTDSTAELWRYYYLSNLPFERTTFAGAGTLFTLGAIPLVYFAISLFMLNREARFSKYQSQILQATWLWLFFSLLFVLYAKDLRPQTMIVFVPGMSLLLTHFFLLIRRKRFIQVNFWILFVGVIGVAYLSRFDKIGSVDYSQLIVQDGSSGKDGQRILVLGDDFEKYARNDLATPFLNWNLSQHIFRHPDYYENVTRVYSAFKNDPPDEVIDREGLMKSFFDRMPDIADDYVRQGDRYVRKVSN